MASLLPQMKRQPWRPVILPALVLLLVLPLVFSCAPAPVKAPAPAPPAAGPPSLAELQQQAASREAAGDFLGAYRLLHAPYLRTLRPDLHRWLLALIARMNLAELETLAGEENSNELRCQVLTRLYEQLAAAAAPPAKKAPILTAILQNCPLTPARRQYYEQQQQLAREQPRPELVVGCLLPLTGDYAAYGRELLQGMELALGVFTPLADAPPPVPLRLLVRDTAGDSEQARRLVRELAQQEGVRIIIGPVAGRAARHAAIEAQSLGVTMISLSPRSGVAATGSHVFQHFLTVRNQAEQLLQLAAGRLGQRNLALFYPATYYGRQFAQVFQQQAGQWGVVLVRREAYDPASDDFGQSIKKLIGARRYAIYTQRCREYKQWQEQQKLLRGAEAEDGESILDLARRVGIGEDELLGDLENQFMPRPLLDLDFEGVVIPDFYQRLRLLIPQLAFYDLNNCRLLGNRSWNSAKLLEDAGPQMEGALFVDALAPAGDGEGSAAAFRRQYEQLFDQPASLYGAYGYDTIRLLRQVLTRMPAAPTSSFDQEAFEAGLRAVRRLPLVTGLTSTLPDGELDKQLYVLTVGGGQIRTVDFSCRRYRD